MGQELHQGAEISMGWPVCPVLLSWGGSEQVKNQTREEAEQPSDPEEVSAALIEVMLSLRNMSFHPPLSN